MSSKRYAIVLVLGFWTVGWSDTRVDHRYYLEKTQLGIYPQGLVLLY
jgi:hypothetical protein